MMERIAEYQLSPEFPNGYALPMGGQFSEGGDA
jgi:hypothetical protein